MSYSPPRRLRFDIMEQTVGAYRTVLDNAQLVVEMALLPFAFVLAVEFLALILPGSGIAGRVLIALVYAAGMLVFGSVFAVRWHRFLLLGETTSGGLLPPGWAGFLTVGIKLSLVLAAGWIVLVFIAALPPSFLVLPVGTLAGVAMTLGAIRVSLVFPAAAIERPIGFMTASDLIAGNFWRLFVCLVMCDLPFIVAGSLILRIGAVFPSLFWIVFHGLQLAASFAGMAVVIALLSQLYRETAALEPAAPASP